MSSDGKKKPRLTPTALDPASPFESTTLRQDRIFSEAPAPISPRAPILPAVFSAPDLPTFRETQLTDPPTKVVRSSSFVELPSGSVVGEIYEIETRLGGGAMGEVYAAHHVRLGKRVAIKVIRRRLSEDVAAIERFAMEAKTLAQVQHPSIVAVEHVGELADGRAYFVMEHLRGESLYARLQRGRLPLPEALRVLDQVARGLEAAHAEGVVHRDLKPENVFLVHLAGEEPVVKLLDFGLAKLRITDDDRSERTQSGVIIGTPMYMSPEQARGPDVDHRTDVYALGIIAYELLLGAVPFPHAKTAPELYAAHLHEVPPLPRALWPEIPPQLDLMLFAMIAKDPAYRPTLAQVRSVIAAVRSPAPSQRLQTEVVRPRSPRPKLRGLATAAIAVIALVIGIAIGTRLSTQPSAAQQREPVAQPPAPAPVAESPPAPTSVTPAAPVAPEPRPEAPPSHPRSATGGGRPSTARPTPTPRAGSAATDVVPIDAGIDARIAEEPTTRLKPPTPAPVDRDQIVNPFAKKHKTNP